MATGLAIMLVAACDRFTADKLMKHFARGRQGIADLPVLAAGTSCS
jgi:hypothetical protein